MMLRSEKFPSDRSDPTLGEGVGDRCADGVWVPEILSSQVAAVLYSLMRPSQRVVRRIFRARLWRVRRVVLGVGGTRRLLVEGSVGSVLVVVVDVVDDDAVELTLVPDDGPVEQLAAQGPDPAFSEGVRHGGANRSLEHFDAFSSEDLIKRGDELAATVTYQSPGVFEPAGVSYEQVAGGLGGPGAGRVGGDTGGEDLSAGHIDDEQ